MRPKLKRIIPMLLVIVTLLSFVPQTVLAADNTSYDGALPIALNTPVSVNVTENRQARYYVFTPAVTGAYSIQSSNNSGDPYGWLRDSNQNELKNDDDSGGNSNFRIYYGLIAGQQYYIRAGIYGSLTGSYTLTITHDTPVSTYTVSYNANGGTGAPASQVKINNISLALSSTVPARTGYTFLGWSTSSTATSATYNPYGSYTANAAATLYAVWKTDTYTIDYDANGGTGAPTSQTKTYGASLALSSTAPTRTGYTFLGWSTSSTATSATYTAGGSYTANASATLYAVWRASTYTISYNANGGTGAPVAQTKTHGVNLTLSSTVPTRSGYTFLGWSTSSTATSATYAAGGSYMADTDITLYAVWKANTYTVSYNANGGTGAPAAQIKSHGVNLTLSSTVPTRTGYTFLGWSTSSTATSATYTKGGSYTANAAATLYAVWKVNTYTVSYNSNGGAGTPAVQTKTHGVNLTLSSTVATKAGYTFLGWSTSSTATSATYTAGGSYTANVNATLYAVWQRNGTSNIPYNHYRAVDRSGWAITSIPDTEDVFESIARLIMSGTAGKVVRHDGVTVYEFSGTRNNEPDVYWKFQFDASYGSITNTNKPEVYSWTDGYYGTVVIGNNGQTFSNNYSVYNNTLGIGTDAHSILNKYDQRIGDDGYTEASAGGFVYSHIRNTTYKSLTVTLKLTQAKIHYGDKSGGLSNYNGYIYIQPGGGGVWTGDIGLMVCNENNNVWIRPIFNCADIKGADKTCNIPTTKVGDYYRANFDVEMSVGFWRGANNELYVYMTIDRLDTGERIYDKSGLATIYETSAYGSFDEFKTSFLMATSLLWDFPDDTGAIGTGSNGQSFTPAYDYLNGTYMKDIVWANARLHNGNYSQGVSAMPYNCPFKGYTYAQRAADNLTYTENPSLNEYRVSIDYGKPLHRG